MFPSFRRRLNYSNERGGIIWGALFDINSQRKIDYDKKYKHELSIVACVKNEAPYLIEWIEYHLYQGVDHFYIYDDGSTDNSREIVENYIKSGIVDWFNSNVKGKWRQIEIYKNCIKKFKNDSKFMLIIDVDEFIYPVSSALVDITRKLEEYNASQLSIPWVIYGSGNQYHMTDEYVISRFTKHQKGVFPLCKSIVNPRRVMCAHVHSCIVTGITVDENLKELRLNQFPRSGNLVRINHYPLKSREEFEKKKRRGNVTDTKNSDDYFFLYDRNEIDDGDLMKKIAEEISIASKNRFS